MAKNNTGYRLVFLQNRNTPKVLKASDPPYTPKPSEGKVTNTRPATEDEAKTIRKGDWLRVDKKGRKPSDSNYGTGSKVRPQWNKYYKGS